MNFPATGRPDAVRAVVPAASDRAAPRLRIAYLCDHSPLDRNLYSGGNARMYDALRAHVGEVEILSQGWGPAEPVRRLMERLPWALNLRLRWRLHLLFGRLTARGVGAELRRAPYDVLFCAYSFQSLHRVVPPPGVLTIFTADATPTVYRNSVIGAKFGSFFAPSRLIDPLITRAEARTFRAADLLLWPSRWQRRAADAVYGLDPARSLTVPWGANIDTPAPEVDPPRIVPGAPVEMLFVGRDWHAKGGPMVLRVHRRLRDAGVDARLTVIGCVPPDLPPDAEAAGRITMHPSLDKEVPAEFAQFQAAFRRAHFLVLPSFESYGFAFCEASAYGLPSLCFGAGGVPVEEGRNGHALPPSASARDFARIIEGYLAAPDRYDLLRRSSRAEFDARLNWDAWGRRVADLVAGHLPSVRRR